MSSCKVSQCRFPQSHTTIAHRCGKCYNYGHGQVECNDPTAKTALQDHFTDRVPFNMHCSIELCSYRWSHTSRAHHCRICGENHSSVNCEQSSSSETTDTDDTEEEIYNLKCPICRVDNQVCTSQATAFGITDECSICQDHQVQVFLPTCGHVCLCWDCTAKLNIYSNN